MTTVEILSQKPEAPKPQSPKAALWIGCIVLVGITAGAFVKLRSSAKPEPTPSPAPVAQAPAPAPAPKAPVVSGKKYAGVMVEAEDFKPQGPGWSAVMNGQGNYMVDTIGFNHISGERVLSGDAGAKDALATATITIPEAGDYRVWSRFEQPTGTDNQFRVEVKQGGGTVGQAVMGEKEAPKYFYGRDKPEAQADGSWGSEGLVEQVFDLKGLKAGAAEVTLVAVGQPAGSANRNIDLLFFTRDLKDEWRAEPRHRANIYRILDAALEVLPPRYYVRLTAPADMSAALNYKFSRVPWSGAEPPIALKANAPSAWTPLPLQDVAHYTMLAISGPAGKPFQIKADFSTTPNDSGLLRSIDWKDDKAISLNVSLPPYPNKYPDEKIATVEEQYQGILAYLKANPSTVGTDPTEPLAWGSYIPVFDQGRVSDAAAAVFHAVGMRGFMGFTGAKGDIKATVDIAKARFSQWGLQPNRGIALGAFRQAPTAENVKSTFDFAQQNGITQYVQRYDFGDEIGFTEWLSPLKDDELKTRFAAWQKQHGGSSFPKPDSSAAAAASNPELYVDSLKFYEETATTYVAGLSSAIPKAFGPDILYGANVSAHPFYYPEIAKYVNWFRPTPAGFAANFGRHSEYFWQVGQPGPLINGYVADHFRAGMRDNPKAMLLQYTMPHSPGNTDSSFRRTAFTHLAHGARGLDYFGMGINDSFTENYIDFRDAARFAAIRDVNRAMATIEDILPTSRVVPSKVAMILSDSTERWDFAGIAADKAGTSLFGDDYKKARLAFHIDRLGMYYALVHNSLSPDLVTEDDVKNGVLKDYTVAYWAGDCIQPAALKALSGWVNGGGRLVATAGAFRFDQYRKPQPAGLQLLGLQAATLEEKEYFFRPQIELPRLKPIDTIGTTPALGLRDKITPLATTKTLASFKGGGAAITQAVQGRGSVTYIATLPGAAYLWSAYQPPVVPSRGPSSHMPMTKFNLETAKQITSPAVGVFTNISAPGSWLDARLLQSPRGFAVSLANYSADVKAPVTLTIRGAGNITSVSSAVAGKLPVIPGAGGEVTVKYAPGLGDILRIG